MEILKLYGRLFSYMLAFIMTITFYCAYFSNDKSVVVYINNFGEAHLEAVVLVISWFLIITAEYVTIKEK